MRVEMVMDERKERLYLEDRYSLRSGGWTGVTIFIRKWFHYNPQVKLTFIEGYHETAEQAEEAITKSKLGERIIGFPDDYPKNFEIVCMPENLLRLAETIKKVCNPNEHSE